MNRATDRGYNGNQNLKGKNSPVEFTQDMVQEYMKCADDPAYFAEKYIKIVHVDHGLIPIRLYDYQKEIIKTITEHRRMAVNTSRQAGKTTTAVVVILHYVLFNGHKTVALLANKGDAAREILDRIKIAYEALPKWLQQGVIEWNKGSVEFENGCKIIAGATSSSAIRGKSISFLYIDETAFVENWDEFFASVFPTISSGNTTKILFTSTPNGLNHFYKTCEGAREGKNGYQFVEVMWYDVPGRDEKWKEETLQAMEHDYQKFSQEFECVTGNTLVTVRCKDTKEEKIITIEDLYAELHGMKYEIATPSGWSDFSGIKKSQSEGLIHIFTASGKNVECTTDHMLHSKYGWVSADTLEVDDLIMTQDGYESITNVYIDRHKKVDVYDALQVSLSNEYYTNGILSHNCGFLGSSGTLIEGSKLKNLVIKDPVAEAEHIKIYEKARPDRTYICIVDVSRGKGLDYSAFQIIDVTEMPYRLVCSYRDNMVVPIDYAEIIYRTIKSYNEAYTLVEVNDIGEQVSEILHYDFEVETLMFTESAGRSGKRISGGFGKNVDRGIRTTKSVKAVGCNMLKLMVEQDQLIVHDYDTINELSTFSRKGNSYEAESGCHDDLVMCLVLFGWLTDQSFFKEITDINTMLMLKQRNTEQMDESLLPLGFNDYDEEGVTSFDDVPQNTWFNY